MEIIKLTLFFMLGILVVPVIHMCGVSTDKSIEYAFKLAIVLNIVCIFLVVVLW